MYSDRSLRREVEDVVDRLFILQTSEVDDSFSEWPAPSKTYARQGTIKKTKPSEEDMSALGPLRADALLDVHAETYSVFGEQAPSSHFLATQMVADYRGEIFSCVKSTAFSKAERKEQDTDPLRREYLYINSMTEDECRAFKGQLKDRIRMWEQTVAAETGMRGVRASRKSQLRALYELYSVSKSRLEPSERAKKSSSAAASSSSTVGADGSGGILASAATSSERPSIDASRDASRIPNNGVKNVAHDAKEAIATAGPSPSVLTTHPIGVSTTSVFPGDGGSSLHHHGRAGGAGNGIGSSSSNDGRSSTKSEGERSFMGSSSASSSGWGGVVGSEKGRRNPGNGEMTAPKRLEILDGIARSLPRLEPGTTPVEEMSMRDLICEKQATKECLLQFEKKVASFFGPLKNQERWHRQGLFSVYRRYSHLKAEVRRRSEEGKDKLNEKDGDTKREVSAPI